MFEEDCKRRILLHAALLSAHTLHTSYKTLTRKESCKGCSKQGHPLVKAIGMLPMQDYQTSCRDTALPHR